MPGDLRLPEVERDTNSLYYEATRGSSDQNHVQHLFADMNNNNLTNFDKVTITIKAK